MLVGMLSGKAIVYTGSAAFHLVCWSAPQAERWALIADVSLVPIAILGGILPFSSVGGLGPNGDLKLGAAVWLLNCALVGFQFRRGHRHTPGGSEPRSIVCILYYLYNEVVAGRAIGFTNPLWQLTPVLYVSAFLCAGAVDKHREACEEPLVFLHHRKGFWSLHEDFHLILLIADVFACWLGWNHVLAIA